MNREQALAIWAPAESPWSPWTKPVLFAFMSEDAPDALPPANDAWQVPLKQGAALLVELPGPDGVELGVGLARAGYRPVPLYNACPYPFPDEPFALPLPSSRPSSTVNVVPILQALERQTGKLRETTLPPAAPPAFLLDARRNHPSLPAVGGLFDNRSILRESDLPTAAFLQAQGIREVILVQSVPGLPSDLCTVLRTWQEGGLTISRQIVGEPWAPQTLAVPKAWWLRAWWERNFLESVYPFKSDGSFGRFVPNASS